MLEFRLVGNVDLVRAVGRERRSGLEHAASHDDARERSAERVGELASPREQLARYGVYYAAAHLRERPDFTALHLAASRQFLSSRIFIISPIADSSPSAEFILRPWRVTFGYVTRTTCVAEPESPVSEPSM